MSELERIKVVHEHEIKKLNERKSMAYHIYPPDVEWLIKQVERLRDLEEGLRLNIKIKQEGIDFLKHKNKQLEGEIEGLLIKFEDNEPYFSNLCLELERKIKGLEQAYDEVVDKNLGLEEQNKRYREAINRFFELDGNYKDIVNKAERIFAKVLDEALEGEK